MQPVIDSTRRRTLVACDQCRSRKDKCDSKAKSECTGCRRRDISCTFNSKRRRSVTPVKPQLGPSRVRWEYPHVKGQHDLPSTPHLLSILGDYFTTCHQGLYFGFIHEPTLVALVTSGNAPRALLLAVCASVLRLGREEPNSESLSLADAWALEARQILLQTVFESFTITDLMIALLLGRYNMHQGSRTAAWLMHGLSTRMSVALKINDSSPGSETLSVGIETRRRLAWAMFVEDSFINAARVDLPHITPESVHCPLPSDEESFLSCKGSTNLDESAYLIRLCALRLCILQYVRGLPQSAPWLPDSQFTILETSLDDFITDLPTTLSFSSTTVFQKKRSGRLVAYLTLHVLIHQLRCDLFQVERLVSRLPSPSPPEWFMQKCQSGRLSHAIEVCNVIAEALPHRPTLDPFMGTCAFQACKSLVYQRRTDESEILEEDVSTALQSGLECLRRLSAGSVVCGQYLAAASTFLAHGGYAKLLQPTEIASYAGLAISRPPSPSLGKLSALAAIERDLDSPAAVITGEILPNPPAGDADTEPNPFDFALLTGTDSTWGDFLDIPQDDSWSTGIPDQFTIDNLLNW